MIRTWLSVILPNDEYRRQKMVYFFAEGSILLVIYLSLLFGIHRFSLWNFDLEAGLGLSIIVFVAYVFMRYIFSGMEHTDVSTEKQYKKQKKIYVMQAIAFIFIFLVIYILFAGFSTIKEQWREIIGLVTLGGIFLFLTNYISLKSSYKKNKDITN